jgi:competence protein ComEC
MKLFLKHWKISLLIVVALADVFIWYGIKHEAQANTLTVAFLNIGQGDAIYIESPTHNQLMIDGGPSNVVLGELSKVMPPYDRSIDALLVTNPDKDHYAGFIDVLRDFTVSTVIEPGTKSDTDTYKIFSKAVEAEHAQKVLARRGMIIHLGGGADLHILYPDHDVSNEKTNDGSIIAKLVYGNTSVMFTGDAPNKTEEYVLSLDGTNVQSTILKEGHHGSRTSASEAFITAVHPQYDVISAGVNNSYGHPHKETIDLLHKLDIPILGTYEKGTIIMKSDGMTFSLQ